MVAFEVSAFGQDTSGKHMWKARGRTLSLLFENTRKKFKIFDHRVNTVAAVRNSILHLNDLRVRGVAVDGQRRFDGHLNFGA